MQRPLDNLTGKGDSQAVPNSVVNLLAWALSSSERIGLWTAQEMYTDLIFRAPDGATSAADTTVSRQHQRELIRYLIGRRNRKPCAGLG